MVNAQRSACGSEAANSARKLAPRPHAACQRLSISARPESERSRSTERSTLAWLLCAKLVEPTTA
eukprot:6682146-Alexandrium_andersonii.AAC.1